MKAKVKGNKIEFPKISYAPLLFLEYCAAIGEVVIVPENKGDNMQVKVDWPEDVKKQCIDFINANLS